MKTHIITKDQLDKDNNYIGKVNLNNFEGHLESEKNLGYIKFELLKIQGYIYFKAGSGIEANEWIEAGEGIKASLGIKAGEWIKAGLGIETDEGIEAGLSIAAKTISSKLRIFAGLCLWRLPTEDEMQIKAKLIQGTIAFGTLIEPVEEVKQKITLKLTQEQIDKIQDILNI